ncbi:MAG: hypothetical protein E4G94_11975 [ANME-2 cluster archaeon]|nr:MAG: hypothetical protein E4G94_11975 [ANME-2 cluster archaeon]
MDGFIGTFIELYNMGAAFILIFMIGQILIMLRNVDKEMLKARIFLREDILEKTWMFIAIAGASFALNAMTNFIETQLFINTYFLNEATQIIFIIAFILAVYQWYSFINNLSKKEEK